VPHELVGVLVMVIVFLLPKPVVAVAEASLNVGLLPVKRSIFVRGFWVFPLSFRNHQRPLAMVWGEILTPFGIVVI